MKDIFILIHKLAVRRLWPVLIKATRLLYNEYSLFKITKLSWEIKALQAPQYNVLQVYM